MKDLFVLDAKQKAAFTPRVIDYGYLKKEYSIDLTAKKNTYSEIKASSINALISEDDFILVSTVHKSILLTRSSLSEKDIEKNTSEAAERENFNDLRMLLEKSVDTEKAEEQLQQKLAIINQLETQFAKTTRENAILQTYSKKIKIAVFNENIDAKHVKYLSQHAFSYAMNYISFTEKMHVKTYKNKYSKHAIMM